MSLVSSYLLVITLYVSRLNFPVKKQRVAEWVKRQDLTICCLHKTHLRFKDTQVKQWKRLHVRTETELLFYIIHKNQLKY